VASFDRILAIILYELFGLVLVAQFSQSVDILCQAKTRVWETKNPVRPDKSVGPVKLNDAQ